jgi:hypothetical protein
MLGLAFAQITPIQSCKQSLIALFFKQIDILPSPQSLGNIARLQPHGDHVDPPLRLFVGPVKSQRDLSLDVPGLANGLVR